MPPPAKTWVRQVREAAKLTQDEFAEKLGTLRETVAKWEELGGSEPSFRYAQKIRSVFPLEAAQSDSLHGRPSGVTQTPSSLEGATMPSELAQTIAFLADRLDTDEQKVQLLLEVKKFVQARVSGSRPQSAT